MLIVLHPIFLKNKLFHAFKVDCSVRENKSKRESLLVEKERAGEPVSAMEREKTMRNLVDMQRKVEQRQQRDRDRQLLRVREVWTKIIINRGLADGQLPLTSRSVDVCLRFRNVCQSSRTGKQRKIYLALNTQTG